MNLIENAIKYSDPRTDIEVKLTDNEQQIFLSVADAGMGISEKEKLRVFDKFYRVGNEDTRKTKGTGLGLYIVKRFVEIYKGEISIADNKPTGTVFRLSFPKVIGG
jgi:signal transduction histidine kinase